MRKMIVKTPRRIALGLVAMLMLLGCDGAGLTAEDPDETGEGTGGDKNKPVPVVGDADYPGAVLTEVQVTHETVTADEPKLIFNTENYSLLWRADNGKQLMFQKVDLDGVGIGSPTTVYSFATAFDVVTEGRFTWAFSGAKYLVAFQASGTTFAILDATGAVTVPFASVKEGESLRGFPAAASDGVDFALVYTNDKAHSSPSHIIFQSIGATGERGEEIIVSDSDLAFDPQIAWHKEKEVYAIVWQQAEKIDGAPEIFFATVDRNGGVVTGPVQVTGSDGSGSVAPTLAAYKDGFALLFRDFREVKLADREPVQGMPQVRLALLTVAGKTIDITGDKKVDASDEYLISNPYLEQANFGTFVPSGEELGIVWGAQSAPTNIYFAQAKLSAGAMIHTIRRTLVTAANPAAANPQIVSAEPGKYFVVWMDERGEGSYQVFGAR